MRSVLCLFLLPLTAFAADPISIEPGQRQLFLDDHVVERMEGLTRRALARRLGFEVCDRADGPFAQGE